MFILVVKNTYPSSFTWVVKMVLPISYSFDQKSNCPTNNDIFNVMVANDIHLFGPNEDIKLGLGSQL